MSIALPTVAALAVIVGLAAAGPITARAAEDMEIGVQSDAVFVNRDSYDVPTAYEQARAVGAKRLRILVTWDQAVRRRRGSRVYWNWSAYDRTVNEARGRGLSVQMTLTGTPAFSKGGDDYLSYDRPSPARLARFARAAAGHFRGRVDRYSIWNEPNAANFLSTRRGRARIDAGGGAALYRRLYIAGHEAIKAADPGAQVLVGETAPNSEPGRVVAPLAFLRAFACLGPSLTIDPRCSPLTADGYAHHPYQFREAPELAVGGPGDGGLGALPRLNATLTALGALGALRDPAGAPLGVYVTEFGYFDPRTRRGVPSERTRAIWLPRAYDFARAQPWVREMVYYHLVEPPRPAKWNSGLVYRSGKPSPAFRALERWSAGRKAAAHDRLRP